jgi:hypothetical protein
MANKEKGLATIPYIAHEYRLFKAYKREKRLEGLLIISNLLWLIIVILLLVG